MDTAAATAASKGALLEAVMLLSPVCNHDTSILSERRSHMDLMNTHPMPQCEPMGCTGGTVAATATPPATGPTRRALATVDDRLTAW